jgi:hypothetical protein
LLTFDKKAAMYGLNRYTTPSPVSLSGNPIVFEVQWDLGDNYQQLVDAGYTIQQILGCDYMGIRISFTHKGKMYSFEENKQVLSTDPIRFEISSYFNKLIQRSVSMDLGTSCYSIHPDEVIVFNVKYGARSTPANAWSWETDTTPTNQLTDSNSYAVINGKFPEYLNDIMSARRTDFYTHFIAQHKFLSWYPSYPERKVLSANQAERLFFYIEDATLYTAMRYKVIVYFEQGPQVLYFPITHESRRIIELAAGLPEIPGKDTDKGLAFRLNFTIEAEINGSWETLSEAREFLIDNRTYRNNTILFYANHVGGYETLWCTGRVVKKPTFSANKRYKQNSYYNGGQTSNAISKTTRYEVNVGRKSRTELRLLEEIMFNLGVVMPISNILMPVDLAEGSIVTEDSTKGFTEVKIEFDLAYIETAFGDPQRIGLTSWGEFFNEEFSSEFLI